MKVISLLMVIQLQRLTSETKTEKKIVLIFFLSRFNLFGFRRMVLIHLQQQKVISLHVEYVTFKSI